MSRKAADPDSLKQCAMCGEWKVRKEGFYYRYRTKYNRSQWDSRCKECRNKTRQEWLYAQRAAAPKSEWVAVREAAPEGTRYCPGCKTYVGLGEFYQKDGKAFGRCKSCLRKKHQETYVPKGRHKLLTEEEKVAKRKQYAHRINVRKRGYQGPIHTWQEWQELLDRTGHKCLKCGKIEDHTVLTRAHVIPLSAGGTDEISNIQPLCIYCNARKQKDRVDYRNPPDEFPGAD